MAHNADPPQNHFPLIVIAGPTGSGKSALALDVAQHFHGEIINCDSLQLYRYFNIGTAKLPPAERRGIPHHLLDVFTPDQESSAGEYAREARLILRDVAARRRVPVVTGGTGFYLRALLEGLFPGPPRDSELRARLTVRETRRPGSLHRILSRLDPQAGRRVHANDVNKLVRALEVCLTARRPMTELFGLGRDPLEGFSALKIGLDPPRDILYERLNVRCSEMFAGGLLDEVRSILARGYSDKSKPFESVGYKQALQALNGELSLEEAVDEARKSTRRYAKRQRTWFLREKDIEWYAGFGSDLDVVQSVLKRVEEFLHKFSLVTEKI